MFSLHIDPEHAVVEPFDPRVVREQYLTTDRIVDWLTKQGVVHGFDRAAIESMVCMGKGEIPPQRSIVVARATPPGEGTPARMQHKFRMGQVVIKGDVLAVKIPPGYGAPGKSVTGEEVGGLMGRELRMRPGLRTAVSADGITCLAATYGVVMVEEDLVDVRPLVRIAEDGMVAWADVYPKTDSGKPVEVKTIQEALRHEGVVYGVLDDAILEAVSRATSTRAPVEEVIVARGKEGVRGEDTSYKFYFKVSGMDPVDADKIRSRPGFDESKVTLDLARMGDTIAVKRPMQPPADGKTVRGEKIECPPVKNVVLLPKEGVQLSDDQLTYVASVPICGYADYRENAVSVTSPLSIPEGESEARLTIHPPDSKKECLDRLLVERLLTNAGVVYGVDWQGVDRLLEEAKTLPAPVRDRVIAWGKQARPGADGRLDFKVDVEKRVGTRRADGSIDFYEQGTIKNVEQGEILLEIVPPTPGEPGVSVRGKEIPAPTGKEVRLQAADNVEISPDGRIFRARKSGMLMVTSTHVGVFDSYVVNGNVDFSTGNIRFEHGSVTISGSVQSTFKVAAKSHVFVRDTVNDAVVTCRGDIEVGRGVVQAGKGYLRAGGSIRCLFAHNARLWAEQDIIIHQSAVNCQLVAGGKVTCAAGKGRIIGGTIKAKEGIACVDLGSEMAVETHVVIGSSYLEIEEIRQEITKLSADIAKVHQVLGAERTIDELYLFPADKREVFRKLILYRDKAKVKIETLTAEKDKIIADSKNRKLASIRVEGTGYPGVFVTILEKRFSLEKEMRHFSIHYHRERDEIVAEGMA
ncbi:MAG: DUF342 domain-containing protein [Planctomycetes bacterium]|nr:DUF342 domain-containing protein [Planctomycetota bacterium]